MVLSEQTKIEAQIGFTMGILIGALAAGIVIQLTAWAWYWKVFSAIGSIGIVGSLVLALGQLFVTRKNYLEAMKSIVTDKELEVIEKMNSPEVVVPEVPEVVTPVFDKKAYKKAYSQRPEVKAKLKAYHQRPEVKAKLKAYQKDYYQKKKMERLAQQKAIEDNGNEK